MIFFQTETGSIYEVDGGAHKIRRVNGELPATERIGENVWKEYEAPLVVEAGRGVFINWPKATTPLMVGSEEGAQPATVTSRVVKVWVG